MNFIVVLALNVMKSQIQAFRVSDMEKFIQHIIRGLINVFLIQKLILSNLQNTLKMEISFLRLQERALRILQSQ